MKVNNTELMIGVKIVYLKFIGEDKSMNLRTGNIYYVDITSGASFIWVALQDGTKCPYSSPQSFAENWIKP